MSPQVVKCNVPAGVGTAKNVRVTLGVQISVLNKLFDYDEPLIESIDPKWGPTSGGIIVTATGKNFGPAAEANVQGVKHTSRVAMWIGVKECKESNI